MSDAQSYETLLIEPHGPVTVIRLNRPRALNALNAQLIHELNQALAAAETDTAVRCVVLTGSEKAFAAGADIKEMKDKDFPEVLRENFCADWQDVSAFRKPLIAAVAGFALGGGCELAMMADFIIAADNAKFGQPEIKLGVIPGSGGSQRLTRLAGKAKAADMVLTGRMMDADEAERCGLAARVVPAAELEAEALKAAQAVAGYSMPVLMLAKEALAAALETPLSEGLRRERGLFHSCFATKDQTEGMAAFTEKRPPAFKDC
ncbi:MAG: enoyl-CoA hydratase-related protein [Rhodospirillales bacterium]